MRIQIEKILIDADKKGLINLKKEKDGYSFTENIGAGNFRLYLITRLKTEINNLISISPYLYKEELIDIAAINNFMWKIILAYEFKVAPDKVYLFYDINEIMLNNKKIVDISKEENSFIVDNSIYINCKKIEDDYYRSSKNESIKEYICNSINKDLENLFKLLQKRT